MEVGYCFVIKFCIFLFSLIFLLLSLQLNHPSSLQRKKEYLNEQVVFTPCQFFGVENFSIGTLMEYSLIKQLYMIWCFILHDDCVYLPFFSESITPWERSLLKTSPQTHSWWEHNVSTNRQSNCDSLFAFIQWTSNKAFNHVFDSCIVYDER